MTANKKVRCNLSGEVYQWKPEYIKKRLDYYETVPLFLRYFIKNKYISRLVRGNTLEEIAAFEGIKLDPTQKAYYEELVQFHLEKAAQQGKIVGKDSKTNFVETDEEVSELLSKWTEYRNQQIK